MSLVKGFRDILTPTNLAVNGAFKVNQRNLFDSLADAAVGDWVCDAWKITTLTFVSCQIQNSVGSGWIRVQANVRKGQQLILSNWVSTAQAGRTAQAGHYTAAHKILVTAEVTVSPESKTVPFKVSINPPYSSGFSEKYAEANYLFTKPMTGNALSRTITRVFESAETLTNSATVQLTALADGVLDLYLYNFKWVVGGYAKLPLWLAYDQSFELERCMKRYQSGIILSLDEMIPVKDSGTATFATKYIAFAAEMAGTPSITSSYTGTGGNVQYRLASGAAVTQEANSGWFASVSDITSKGFKIKFQRSTYLANIMAVGPADTAGVLNWTATAS